MKAPVQIEASDLSSLRGRAVLRFVHQGVVLGDGGVEIPHDRRIEVLAPHHPDQLPSAEFTVRMQGVVLLFVTAFGNTQQFCCFRIAGSGSIGSHFAYCVQCGASLKFTPDVLPNGERGFAPKHGDMCGQCDAPLSEPCDRCWHTWGRCHCCPPETK